jgi:adenosine deaminase
MKRLVEEDTILCVAPTSNLRTGAVPDAARFPLKRLLDAGVRVTLSADDPVLFGTTTAKEYRFAAESLGVSARELSQIAGNGWHAAFCTPPRGRTG